MDAFQPIVQLFAVSINRDMSQPNSPKMKRYRRADDMHAMLNDDLEISSLFLTV